MKKLLLLSLFTFNMAIAQEFILTPNNFVNKDDDSKNYIVLEYPEMSQKQLFDKTKIFVQTKFENLKSDGLNEVEYSFIKIRTTAPGTRIGGSLMSLMMIVYELNFKDGKIMVKPILDHFDPTKPTSSAVYLTGGNSFSGKSIFDKTGKISLKNYFEVSNTNVNKFVTDLKDYLSKSEEW
ncbi:hypothetical protein [Chryseobacterium turcicum]|uniref:DUF4468 domain-containing protein n=1 Tax=Chryseobacterium turcicum TaxID=2898076 RepID=A0A9Q3UXA8_9FLAO|nr:hypothetical protein [Chryseobacterium turcicum]MCD1115593.1 hypothetical protein [Chryseobacterium turcicum]